MKKPEEFINPWVVTAEPYSDKHMDVAWENPDILRMMSNENLLEPPEAVLDAIIEAARLGNLYPGSGPQLRKKLGEKAGLTLDHVVLGNGSTDVINFVVHTFVGPGDEVLIPVPTFPMYESRTKVAGGIPVQVPFTPDFYWDMDAIMKAVTPKTKLIFICSPNNPTGNRIADQTSNGFSAWAYPPSSMKPITNCQMLWNPKPAGSKNIRTWSSTGLSPKRTAWPGSASDIFSAIPNLRPISTGSVSRGMSA